MVPVVLFNGLSATGLSLSRQAGEIKESLLALCDSRSFERKWGFMRQDEVNVFRFCRAVMKSKNGRE